MVVLISAGMLIGPFNGEDGALVVIQVAHIITSPVVILRVKEPRVLIVNY